jgi:phosphoglycerate kinase
LRPGQILLLENLRFHKEEEANDGGFAQALAGLCDLYVNDAFGSAHRAHASTEGMTKFVPKAAAGFLMEKELTYLGKATSQPDRPYIAILGGAKVSDKIEVVQNLMKLTDAMLIGGGMAYTFLKARGVPVGKSLVEDDKLDVASSVLDEAARRKFVFKLPVDHVVAAKPDAPASGTMRVEKTPPDCMGLDIGPETINEYCARILSAETIVWNGPMGVFEQPQFARGTRAVAEAVAKSSGTSIIGGGDSIAAVQMVGVADRITHISTGGGASLEFLAGCKLPGVEALTDK